MQTRILTKANEYLKKFKDDIMNKGCELNLQEDEKFQQLLQLVYDYNAFTYDDVAVKKEISDAKKAKVASKTTKTKKKSKESVDEPKMIWVEDIGGIIYHIDNDGNVYKQEDIMYKKENPEIIARYMKENGKYHIVSFHL
jgi:hypothetical protein